MAIAKPFNLAKWIEDNRQLKPPVGNKIYTSIQVIIL
jgi:3-hydroxyanthranilate 3,4-dioxygenase